jgi:hypothetical protein
MSIRTFRNAFNCDSLFVPAGTSCAQIPMPYRDAVGEDELAYLSDPTITLNNLAAQSKWVPIQKWLLAIARSKNLGLIIHYAEIDDFHQTDVTVCGSVFPSFRFANFRLPIKAQLDDLPYPLNELYQVTNGILNERDAFLTSQFLALDELYFNFQMDTDQPIDMGKALTFYRSDTGDYCIANGEDAWAFTHENRHVKKIGKLSTLLDSYFEAELSGGRWNPITY